MKSLKPGEKFSDDYLEGLEDAAVIAAKNMNVRLEKIKGITEETSFILRDDVHFERLSKEILKFLYEAKMAQTIEYHIRNLKTEWWIQSGYYDSGDKEEIKE